MADIAVVFHWPLAELEAMALGDLIMWREQARRRHESKE